MGREGSSADFARVASLEIKKANLEMKQSNLTGHLNATRSALANYIADPNDPSPFVCHMCEQRIIAAYEIAHRAVDVFESFLRFKIQQLDDEIQVVVNELNAL